MKIGEAARRSGLSQKMLRYYESIGLVKPRGRGDNGYRDYSEVDLQRLTFIRRARELGFPLADVGRLLALWDDTGRSSAEVHTLASAQLQALDERIAQLSALRASLAELIAACHADRRSECAILGRLGAPEPL